MRQYRVAQAIVLRPESFGGMAFHTRRAITVELDAEGYELLCSFCAPRFLPASPSEAYRLTVQLRHLGFIEPVTGERLSAPVSPAKVQSDEGLNALEAPEIVHLALTARCDLTCPGCYAVHGKESLPWPVLRHLIDQLAEMHVFQLALGGGEPTLHLHLVDVVAYARQRKIVSNITTHGGHLTSALVAALHEAGVGQINVSLNANTPERNAGRGERAWHYAMAGLEQLRTSGIATGVNCLVTAQNLACLPDILSALVAQRVRQVTILGPKPANNPHWLTQHQLADEDYCALQVILQQWHEQLNITVDCALVGRLMHSLPANALRNAGIYGCMAAQRMCVIDARGNVWPCAFQQSPQFCAGSILDTPFRDIWLHGPGFQRFRRVHHDGGIPCYQCESSPAEEGCAFPIGRLSPGTSEESPCCQGTSEVHANEQKGHSREC